LASGRVFEQVVGVHDKVHYETGDHLAEHGEEADDEQCVLAARLQLGGDDTANALEEKICFKSLRVESFICVQSQFVPCRERW
jgi:hypothetical protein